MQVKMRLVGISPMIWRRLLLPAGWTLEELHGVIQAAMGWEGLHLYEFRIRSARYSSPELCAGPADVTLESLRFRRNDRDDRYFGFVQNHDPKPKRRLFEVLHDQGLQMNQEITFLTDGGNNVRELAERMSPSAEHIFDWFHLTMRLTVLGQYAKGLRHHGPKQTEEAEAQIEKIKWYLWNGNVREALFRAECLADDLENLTSDAPSI